jgi:hypothetical protein
MVSELKVLGFLLHSETLWNFHYNFFSTTIQNERLGGYLVYGSRYIGLNIHLLRPYTFGDTTFVR